MQLRRLTVSALSLSVFSAFVFAAPLQAQTLIPKQLAGPPEEFSLMAAPDPAEAAIHSKSALVPIEFGDAKVGEPASAQLDLPVIEGAARFLVFAGETGRWQVDLTAPGGTREKAASLLATEVQRTAFGIEGDRHQAEYYALEGVASGRWTLTLRAKAGAPRQGYVLVEGDAATELASWQTHRRQHPGERIGVVAMLTAQRGEESPKLGHAAGRIDRATLRVTAPDGRVESIVMHDDGRHDDGAAGDGLFGGHFLATQVGTYLSQVQVRGEDSAGALLLRSAEHVVPVVERALALDTTKRVAGDLQDGSLRIALPVQSDKHGQHYRAYAEVWGSDKRGNAVPVAWIGGMTTPQEGRLTLGLDARWIQRAGAQAPFSLRQVRIEDPDRFVSVAEADLLPLSLPTIKAVSAESIAIDERMRMGPRPPAHHLSKGVGTRLLLVHGYCSGGVWPTGHFSNASTFLDANKNRSHDQFARLIQSFGSTWNSFGVVAHSQGGAAALHLYNYYWSGLDYATGNRLIQSVGTPYKGTNLAGVLAALGGIFGVGCGTNNDLTYSGASSWLAGIATASRAKVNYYTTSFRTTNWWTNDYCNFASDLVLSDPEDGTTEVVNGQLPGGINRGNTSGQCHTAGMRDPAQYLDASRNATMNSNAAR